MRDLREGDIIQSNYGLTMRLLVHRNRVKKAGPWHGSKGYYVWEGTFLDLQTGETVRMRLGSSLIRDHVIWAPREPVKHEPA